MKSRFCFFELLLVSLLCPILILSAPKHKKPKCHGVLGDASDRPTQVLDSLKNRSNAPTSYDNVTIDDILAPGKDSARFNNDMSAKITGFVIDDTLEAGESCNCHSPLSAQHDFHIYMSNKAKARKRECMIVEITPAFRDIHPEWTEQFVYSLRGKKITVSGWMLYDFKHTSSSIKYNPGGKMLWRNTCWEVHPVTSVEVVSP